MKRSIVALAQYIHAIINSPLTAHDLGTNFHDQHGIKYQLPCGAFLLRTPANVNRVADLHESLQKTWILFYCIGNIFDDDFLKVFICERDCREPQSMADDPNCYNTIENHLYFYSNLEYDVNNYTNNYHLGPNNEYEAEYHNSKFVIFNEHEDSNGSFMQANHENTIKLLKAHFQSLAKFASPQKYEKYKNEIVSENKERQRQNINEKKKQKSDALISMVKELFDEERHTLTDYGLEKFMSYFETRTPEVLFKLLKKSVKSETASEAEHAKSETATQPRLARVKQVLENVEDVVQTTKGVPLQQVPRKDAYMLANSRARRFSPSRIPAWPGKQRKNVTWKYTPQYDPEEQWQFNFAKVKEYMMQETNRDLLKRLGVEELGMKLGLQSLGWLNDQLKFYKEKTHQLGKTHIYEQFKEFMLEYPEEFANYLK